MFKWFWTIFSLGAPESRERAEIISFNSVYYLISGSAPGWIICYCFLMDVNFRKDDLEECNTIDVMCWKWLSYCVNCILQLATKLVETLCRLQTRENNCFPSPTPSKQCPHNVVQLYVRRTNVWNTRSPSFLLRVGDKTRQRFWTRITLLLVLSLHNYYDVTVTWLPCEHRLFDLRRAASAYRVWFLEYDRHHDQILLRTENLCLNSDEVTFLFILIHALFLCSYHSHT